MSFSFGFGQLGAGQQVGRGAFVPNVLSAARGTFILTGNAASLLRGNLLVAAAATFALTGQSASLLTSHILGAGSASFAMTGNDAALTKATPGAFTLVAGAGTFALTGDTMTPLVDYLLPADVGAFVMTGQAASLVAARKLATAAGSFAFTGQAATLTKSSSDAAETTAFLARTSGLSPTETSAYKTLINGLVADGLWSKFDAFYIFATNSTTTANLNLVGTNYGIAPLGGSASFAADIGYTTSGAILDTGFVPNAGGTQYSLNSGCIGIYIQSNDTGNSNRIDIGSTDANFAFVAANYTLSALGGVNDVSVITTSSASSMGLWADSRTASNATALYKNGSSTPIATNTISVSAAPAFSMYIGARNTNGTASEYTNRQYSGAFIGAGLTGSQYASVASRVNAYMTTVGANVF